MKKQYTFTIDEELYEKFRKHSKKRSINKSLLVETSIRMWMEIDEKKLIKSDDFWNIQNNQY